MTMMDIYPYWEIFIFIFWKVQKLKYSNSFVFRCTPWKIYTSEKYFLKSGILKILYIKIYIWNVIFPIISWHLKKNITIKWRCCDNISWEIKIKYLENMKMHKYIFSIILYLFCYNLIFLIWKMHKDIFNIILYVVCYYLVFLIFKSSLVSMSFCQYYLEENPN